MRATLSHAPAQGTAWESIHVVQVDPDSTGKRATYKLNTTIMLSVQQTGASAGDTNLSGNVTSAMEQSHAFACADDHLANIGKMIEKMENDVRSNIDG